MSDDVPDHYAALDLTPSCSSEDISKAYKKLALKYHPDRNRGNEDEAVPRFQAIQAAHEVLKDKETRKKYDLSRAKPTYGATGFSRQPGTRGNPYQARSDFPPPPMRTNPSARQSPNTARRGNGTPRGGMGSGMFPPPPPPRAQQKTSAGQDARDRANMFEAWQSMHGKRTSPERKSHSQASPTKGAPHAGAFFAGAHFAGVNLDPRVQPQRASSDDAAQKKSAYQSTQEQRPGMHRTPSHQPPPRRAGFDPSTPGMDERPASQSAYSYNHKRPDDETGSNMNGYTQRGHAPTAKRPETQSSYNAAHSDGTRARTDHDAHSRSRAHVSPEDRRQFKNAYDTSSPHMQQERGPFGRPTATANSRHRSVSPRRQHQHGRPLTTYSSSSDSDIESSAARSPPRRDPQDRPKAVPRARRSGTSTPSAGTPSGMDGSKEGPNIFSFPIQPDTFQRSFGPVPPPGKINTNFSSSTSSPAFHTPTDLPRRPSQPGTFSFTFHGGPPPNTTAQQSQTTTPLESSQPPPAGTMNGTEMVGNGVFSADQWSQTLGSTNWASQWAQAPQARTFAASQSPTRRSRSVKHGSTRIPSNMPRPVSIADEEAGPPQDWTDSDSNAMDVDSTIPAGVAPAFESAGPPVPPKVSEQSPTTPTQPPQARTVYVEPSKAEWAIRPPTTGTAPSQPPQDAAPSITTSDIPPPPPPASTRPPPASSTLNMNDFRHVAPFDTTAASSINGPGLTNLTDMTTTLPFDSKPSFKPPTTATAPPLDLPKLPKAPTPPTNLTSSSPESQSELLTYLRSMAAYLTAWSTFKSTLLSIMQSQTARIGEMEQDAMGTGSGDIMRDWLIASGETETKRGWEAYRVAVKQEERVREYWKVASERHWRAVEGHERVRERLRALGEAREA